MGAKIAALWQSIKKQWTDVWDKDKGIFFLVALAAVVLKFRDILIDILINSAKNVEKNANKKDEKLASQEADLKTQADAQVQKAQDEPKKETPVDDDWYKKGN